MMKINNKEISPVMLILKKYPQLPKVHIIRQVAFWFNVIGKDEFDKARNQGIIIQVKDYPNLWELADKTCFDDEISGDLK